MLNFSHNRLAQINLLSYQIACKDLIVCTSMLYKMTFLSNYLQLFLTEMAEIQESASLVFDNTTEEQTTFKGNLIQGCMRKT